VIFHEHRTIFLHPGKTAGTAVEEAFGYTNLTHPAERLDFGVFKGWDPEALLYVQHAPARYMNDRIPGETWRRYLRFATVRNPYDRILSVYCFQLKRHRQRFGSFAGFVAALPEMLGQRRRGMNLHVLPQTEYTHLDGECIVDLLVRFEALREDWARLRRRVRHGPPLPERLARVNTATGDRERRAPTEEYAPEARRIVQELYAPDFELLGYSAEAPAEAEAERLVRRAWRTPRVAPTRP